MREMVYVGEKELLGEVIRVDEDKTMIQVYESTTGLRPNEPVKGTGHLLNATLGPGILRNIYDGIQRPLDEIAKEQGAFISEGKSVPALDLEKKLECDDVSQGRRYCQRRADFRYNSRDIID